jgi:hypothetical protein
MQQCSFDERGNQVRVRRDNTQQKGVWGMPKASGGEEGRGKRRNAVGTRWQGLIHRYPNGATHCLEEAVPYGGQTR